MSEILTVREVSKRLRIHPMTTYKLLRARKIPAVKIGGQWRFQWEAVLAWVSQQAQANVLRPRA